MEEKLHSLHAVQKQINEIKQANGEDTSEVIASDAPMPDAHKPKPAPVLEEEEKSRPVEKPAKEWIPFLWVGNVSEESPAEAAGLKEGDVIVKFEEVTHEFMEGLNAVAKIVQSSENLTLNVKVIRKW